MFEKGYATTFQCFSAETSRQKWNVGTWVSLTLLPSPCPNCVKQEYTSAINKEYHVEARVCSVGDEKSGPVALAGPGNDFWAI